MAGVGRREALTWSFTLLITCLLGVGVGLSLGYAIFNSPEGTLEAASTSGTASRANQSIDLENPQDIPLASSPQAVPKAKARQDERESTLASLESTARTGNSDEKDFWAARHLFIAVNGQWLAEGTKAFLHELRPGGVVLRDVNLQNRIQTLELVKEIKLAGGSGGGLGNLPLIAVQEEIGPPNRLGLTDAPSARELGRSGDDGAARELGESYARACVERGIGVAFSPVLDVYESGSVDPGFESRSFGTDQTVVARIGLAMVEGMRQGGVIPAVKHFPGYGASTYGSDGTLVVLNKDFSGLAKVMYPFNEAVRKNVEGIVVGYMAVPALDKASPRRPAALSPVLVTELLRNRWGFEGVILAGDVMSNGITLSRPAERVAVEALAAGCDAIVLLDANPQHIRVVRDAIEQAVRTGELSREALQRSSERLENWQDLLNKTPGPGNSRSQRMTKSTPASESIPGKDEGAPRPRDLDTRVAKATPSVGAENSGIISTSADPVEKPSTTVEPKIQPITLASPGDKADKAIEQTSDPDPALAVTDDTVTPDEDGVTVLKEEEELQPGDDSVRDGIMVPEAAPADTPPNSDAPAHAEEASGKREAEIPPVATVAVVSSETKPSEEPDKLIVTKVPESTPEDTTAEVPITAAEKDLPPFEASKDAAALRPDLKSDVAAVEESPVRSESPTSAADPSDSPGKALEGKMEQMVLTARTEALSAAMNSGELEHTVREDEFLSHIASIYGVSAADIVRWNGLSHARLKVGSKLIIRFGPEPEQEIELEQDAGAKPDNGTSLARLSELTYKVVHVVKQGQNLNTLAKRYTVSTDNLKLWNGLDKETLEVGQKITVFLGSPRNASDSSPELKIIDYQVKVGDTLSNIGRRFGTTPELLLQMNGLKDPNHIWVGQKLKLPVEM